MTAFTWNPPPTERRFTAEAFKALADAPGAPDTYGLFIDLELSEFFNAVKNLKLSPKEENRLQAEHEQVIMRHETSAGPYISLWPALGMVVCGSLLWRRLLRRHQLLADGEREPERRSQPANETKGRLEDPQTPSSSELDKTPETHSLPTAPTAPVIDKMSVKAIVGAALTGSGLFFLAVGILGFGAFRTGIIHLAGLGKFALATFVFIAGTLIGAPALGDIRRSNGCLRGLPLALFASLCWPLLLFDSFFAWAGAIIVGGIMVWSGHTPSGESALSFSPAALLGFLSLLIDFLAVRRIWLWAQGGTAPAAKRR